ncbi:LysR family transcriptional regulator [Rhodoferax koreense]|uniref:LysR family transcriptional regulator n=1 Tax=Rhodoferax koreensis TaxID=1842727 RepID=A0A1P8JVQ7_9BURK|nr:LysR substrate-binding domain-containing protein [Rhodoferax koreense]APW37832.1 LysR family transcriptional regulator [Rhodoferax koreense]
MELRHLRYFVATAELGSITRASEKLFMAQPPLSAQLKQLEDEVGVPLFVRMPRGVRLTEAGVSFLEDARAILARSQQAGQRARERQAGARASLRIGLVPSAIHSVLPGFLRRLHEAGLDARVEAREMITSKQQLALRDDELDLGFARPGAGAVPLETVAVIDDPYAIALPAGHPLAASRSPMPLALAAQAPFVGFARHRMADYFDRTVALCQEAGFTPDIRCEAGQFVSVLALVASGLGVAIVPSSLSTLDSVAGGAVVFRPLQMARDKSRLAVLAPAGPPRDAWSAQIASLAAEALEELGRRLESR